MSEKNDLAEMEVLFLALADKTRLRILNLMRSDEVCVYHFTEVLRVSQPKISRHLAYLRNAGAVTARREGKWVNYRIARFENIHAAELVDRALRWLEAQSGMREDYERLRRIRGETSNDANHVSAPNTFVQANIKRTERKELETFLL